ncbi:hypothetical protein FD733_17660 [Pantoea sp. Eser]|nr:hypothetical protein [Pantoea sp. Eser]
MQAPAVHSAIVGFKPTVGRVSRHGFIPLVAGQDSPGPLTRTVDDAQLIYQAICGADMNDTATLAVFPAETQRNQTLQGLRIGVPRRFIADTVLTPAREAVFDRLLHALAQAGAVIVDPCDLPAAEQLNDVRSCVFRAEFRAGLNRLLTALKPCGMGSL